MPAAERSPAHMTAAHESHSEDVSLEEMAFWGEKVGGELQAPLIVTLQGDLGAGKTTLVQALCRGYGVTEAVTSPTFALVHEYHAGKSPVFHLDLYRLDNPAQLANIGWEDVLAANALVLIEWPEHAGAQIPESAFAIALAHVPGQPDLRRLSW